VVVEGRTDQQVSEAWVGGRLGEVVNGSFRLAVMLAPGLNQVEVMVADAAGNRAAIVLAVTVDDEPPMVDLYAPDDGAKVNGPRVNISGFVADHGSLTINGQTIAQVFGVFLVRAFLVEGDNLIQLEATDEAGNIGHEEILVQLDTVPPTIALDGWARVLGTQDVVTVWGRAAGAVRLVVNGLLVALDSGGNFSIQVLMGTGSNRLVLEGFDEAGNGATIEESVVLVADAWPGGSAPGVGWPIVTAAAAAFGAGSALSWLLVRGGIDGRGRRPPKSS
jgi:hypothetical protein